MTERPRSSSRWLAPSRWLWIALPATLLLALIPLCLAPGRQALAGSKTSPSVTQPTETIAEPIFWDGLHSGWKESGWCQREVGVPGPAQVQFARQCAWLLTNPSLKAVSYGALVFQTQPGDASARTAPPVLEVRLDSSTMRVFPRVVVRPERQVAGADDWSDVRLSMRELNPDDLPFERIVLRAVSDSSGGGVTLINHLGLTRAGGDARADEERARATPLTVHVDGEAAAAPISPLIFGIAYYAEADLSPVQWELGAAVRRWGGNTTSRYNWELGAWNTAADWYFENRRVPSASDKFLADDAARGLRSALTVPLLGWVAKDSSSVGFPVSRFGPQGHTDPWLHAAGDGTSPSGTLLHPGDPSQTSLAATPAFVERWVETIRAQDAKRGKRSVDEYILDNEPMNWARTHRDVRTTPLGYDELLQRTLDYGSAIRRADPGAVIAGPALWGWTAYFYSGIDGAAGFFSRPDRRAHGDLPLVAWYLRKLRERQQQTGIRVVDLLDLHFYPQGDHVYGSGGNDSKTAALRLRQTRGLWDPTYVDESWIKEPIRLLPRMKEWIDQNYPGTGLSIGEWNFGGEAHVSGALAIAEALGRFAQFGVYSAFYWTFPPAGAPAIQGFLAFRNFDGRGGRFLDWYLPSTSSSADVSVFASRDESGKHLVLIEINRSAEETFLLKLTVGGGGPVTSSRAFAFGDGRPTFTPVPPTQPDRSGDLPSQLLAPWSIHVVDVHLASAVTGALEH